MNRRQAIPTAQRYTIRQFRETFPTDDACLAYMMERRFPGCMVLCVNCGIVLKHHRVSGRTCYACQGCGSHVFPLAGTIFHKTTTALTTWFYVIYQMAATRAGISAKQIQRETGVTYKTAWRMMRQVRSVMAESVKLHNGPVEIDEGFFGGSDTNRAANSHLRGKAKTTALAMVERGGRVVARVIADKSESQIAPVVAATVWPRSTVYTDANPAYEGLRYLGMSLRHGVVNKSEGFRAGHAHTNSVEGFWSLVKRGISGVYYQVGADYLQSYLNEYAFRYNRRKAQRPMFSLLLERGASTLVCASAREERLEQARRLQASN